MQNELKEQNIFEYMDGRKMGNGNQAERVHIATDGSGGHILPSMNQFPSPALGQGVQRNDLID